MRKIIIIITAVAMLAGCASTSQLKQLQAENAALRQNNTNYAGNINTLELNIVQLKKNLADLNEQLAVLNTEKTSLAKLSAEQQTRLNQNQVVIQVTQERLERLEKLLVIERAKAEDLKAKLDQAPNSATNSSN